MYRILLVEDDERIASLLGGHLQKYGYEVKIAEQLNDIKLEFTEMKPDLVLLDINLPFLTGFIGAGKSVPFPMRRLSLYRHGPMS